jgi:hypothetical protein
MYNWSHIDEEAMKRQDPVKYQKWRIVQMLNYDMQGERLDREEVKKYWPEIKDELFPHVRQFIDFILWNKQSLPPISGQYWNKRPTTNI